MTEPQENHRNTHRQTIRKRNNRHTKTFQAIIAQPKNTTITNHKTTIGKPSKQLWKPIGKPKRSHRKTQAKYYLKPILAKYFTRLIFDSIFIRLYQFWLAAGLYFGAFGVTFLVLGGSWGRPGRVLGRTLGHHGIQTLKNHKTITFWDLSLGPFFAYFSMLFEMRFLRMFSKAF